MVVDKRSSGICYYKNNELEKQQNGIVQQSDAYGMTCAILLRVLNGM